MKRTLAAGSLFIFLLMIAVTIGALYINVSLRNITTKIFEHPFTVNHHLMYINNHIVSIHRSMKDVVLATNKSERDLAIGYVNQHEKVIYDSFNIILKRFLGDKQKVLAAHRAFTEWRPIRDEVISLVEQGKKEQAAAVTKGKGQKHVLKLNTHMESMILYAMNKANSLYQDSFSIQRQSQYTLVPLLAVLLTIAVLVIFHAYKLICKYENSLQESVNRFKTLVETTSDWIWEIDTEANFKYVSPGIKSILGYEPEELMNKKSAFDLMEDDESEKIREQYHQFVKSGAPFNGMVNINIHKNGSQVVLESSGQPFFDADGTLLGYRGIDRDITERKTMIKSLERAQTNAKETSEERSLFLAHITHEIRTPLGALISMMEALSETDLSSEQHHYLDLSNLAGKALLAQLNDILDMSKLEMGQLILERKAFNMTALVEETLQMFEVQAKEKGITLSLNQAKNFSPNLIGDENRIRQILLNLIGNSLKFTAQGSIIIVLESNTEGETSFSISDTGIGIPSDKLESIFRPYNQGDSSINGKYGGTGLGLSICQLLVKKMKGSLRCDSKEGVGAKFIVSIPLDRVP